MEKTISSKQIYQGKILELVKDEVELDDKTKSLREVIKHHGGVAIALKSKNNKYYMVKQYRYAQRKAMIEFCAGKLNADENILDAIKRETIEELGYSVKNIKELGYIVPTCGYSSEVIYLYYGEADEYKGQHFDVDERIETLEYTFKEIKEMIKNGYINDAKTICLIQRMELEGIDG